MGGDGRRLRRGSPVMRSLSELNTCSGSFEVHAGIPLRRAAQALSFDREGPVRGGEFQRVFERAGIQRQFAFRSRRRWAVRFRSYESMRERRLRGVSRRSGLPAQPAAAR